MAIGVLPVLLGRATRLADYIQQGRKTYVATVALGAATDTDDAVGTVIASSTIPPLTQPLLEETLDHFEGEILQTPPRYSALKIAGQRAYAVARAGGEFDLAPRRVTIHALSLVDWSPTELQLDITCSKGTYIRALARDIAVALGTLGHLTALTRTAVGPFRLEQALSLDEVAARGVADALLAPSVVLPDIPTFTASDTEAVQLANGRGVAADLCAESVWVYDPSDRLVCLASADGNLLRPRLAL
jgi:tRNA pseudouridine55 synthase